MGLLAPQHMGSSWMRDWTHVSCIGGQILYHWATREAPVWFFKILFIEVQFTCNKIHQFKYMIWWIVTNVYSLVSTIIMGIWNVSFTPQSPRTLSESVLSLQPCHWFLSLYSLLHLEFHINAIIQVCSVLYLFLSFTWHNAFEIYSSCCAHH